MFVAAGISGFLDENGYCLDPPFPSFLSFHSFLVPLDPPFPSFLFLSCPPFCHLFPSLSVILAFFDSFT